MDALAVDLKGLEEDLAGRVGRPLVVHHFATWCDPCEEELPLLRELLASLDDVDYSAVAVAWDLFMAPVAPEVARATCARFLEERSVSFDACLVYTGSPPELFQSQGIESESVPYTEVRDAAGQTVATFAEPLFDEDSRRALGQAVRDAASGAGG